MSREFGDYGGSGYFHDKIRAASDDCKSGRDPLTKLWHEFLDEFYHVSYAISTSEACDSGPYYPIMESIARMPVLKAKLHKIDLFLEDYRRVAEEAIRTVNEKKTTTRGK